MSSLSDLRPGDIGFGPIKGAAGLLVNAGQLMLGEGFHVGDLDIRHVFIVTEAGRGKLGSGSPSYPQLAKIPEFGPYAVEAMPSGAREENIVERWTPEYAYVRLPEDYPGQASDAAAIARAMIGTPYSFASYAALAAWRFGISTPRLEKWIGRRRPHPFGYQHDGEELEIGLPAEAICSVLADQAWTLAGKKVMTGVPHQCVTPGALAKRLLWMPGARWMVPE